MRRLISYLPRTKWARRLTIFAACLLGLLALTLILLRWAAMSPVGRGYAETQIEALSPLGQTIEIEGLRGDLLGDFTVDALRVSDAEGEWLHAENVQIEWGPLSLVSRTLNVRELQAGRLFVARQPNLVRQNQPPRSSGAPINRLRFADVSIADLELNEAVTGRSLKAALEANLDTKISTGLLGLELTPANTDGDQIVAALEWGGAEQFLIGDLTASGPASGLLASLLGTGTDQPVEVSLEASGSKAAWQTDAHIDLGEVRHLEMVAHGSETEAELSGFINLAPFAALNPLQSRLGDRLDVSISALDGGEASLTAVSETLVLSASAPYDLQERYVDLAALDVTARARNDRILGLNGVGFSETLLQGRLDLTDGHVTFDGEAEAQDFSMRAYSAETISGPLTLTFDRTNQRLDISTDLASANFASENEAVMRWIGRSPAARFDGHYDIQTRNLLIRSAKLSLESGDLTADGSMSFRDAPWRLKGDFTPDRTAETWPDAIDAQPMLWTVSRGTDEIVQIALSSNLRAQPSVDLPVLRDPFEVSAELRIAPEQGIQIQSARLENPAMQSSASGVFRDGLLRLDISARSSGLHLGEAGLSNSDLQVRLAGPLNALQIDAVGQAKTLTLSANELDDFSISVIGAMGRAGFTGNVALTSIYLDRPLRMDGQARYGSGAWSLRDLLATYDGLSLSGEASGVGARSETVSADLKLLGRSQALGWLGEVDANLDISSERLLANAQMEGMRLGNLRLAKVLLSATGTQSDMSANMDLTGTLTSFGSTLPVTATSHVDLDLVPFKMALVSSGSLDDRPFRTVRPISIFRDGGSDTLSGGVEIFDGGISIDAVRGPDLMSLDATLENLNASALGALFGRQGLRGSLSGQQRLETKDNQLFGSGGMQLIGLSQGAPDAPAADLALNWKLADEVLALELAGEDKEDALSLSGRGSVPVLTSASPTGLALDQTKAMTFELEGEGPIEGIWSLLGPPDTRFEGLFDLSLEAAGQMKDLSPKGQFTLKNGVFEDGILGFKIQDIALDAALIPGAINVSRVSAEGAKGGKISGNGRYGFDGTGAVAIELDRLNALQRSDVSATLSGILNVQRDVDASLVEGNLVFDRASVDINRLPRGGFTTLDVKFPARDGEAAPQKTNLSPVRLDIGLKADRGVFVSGTGLSSEWALDADLTGTVRAPRLNGSARIVRGDVDVVGRQFRFDESSIRFAGDPREAQLNIRAVRSTSDLTASLNVSGTPLSPEISLGSDPALPDDEVFSRVLFGVSPSQLSPLQAAQLASAIASLSGGGGALDLVGPIEDVLDIDRLDIGIAENGAASIGAGKYLAEDVYVEVRTNTRGAPGLGVEWTPRSNLEVGAELATEEAPKFTIKWKRDYDLDRPEDGEKSEVKSE